MFGRVAAADSVPGPGLEKKTENGVSTAAELPVLTYESPDTAELVFELTLRSSVRTFVALTAGTGFEPAKDAVTLPSNANCCGFAFTAAFNVAELCGFAIFASSAAVAVCADV
jgi:hypothetical protein